MLETLPNLFQCVSETALLFQADDIAHPKSIIVSTVCWGQQ